MMDRLSDAPDRYEAIVRKTLDKFIPFKVDWEITYRCNLRCSHCYQTGPCGDKELTAGQICLALDELADLGCLYVTFTGGEILLRKDFFEIAKYARKKEFAIRLFTNGTLIDERTADKIRKLNPLSVEISLYGMGRLVHENITRTPGSYEETINALKLLRQRDINTVVKCTFMKGNVSEFSRLKDFAQTIGARFVFSLSVIPRIDGSKDVLENRLDQEQLQELFRSKDWLTEGITEGGIRSYRPLCSAGANSLYISPYGEVSPCVVVREYCGNLTRSSLKEIWESPFFNKIRCIELEDLKECRQCDSAGYCDRCSGLALLETGDLLGPSPNECDLARVRRWAVERKEADHERTEEAKTLQEAQNSV
ncbi:MAG: radical SAM protein [Planctomycetota bacterium]|jgi:radical SAM protein with 4Fe4S-binding SPASM domain